MGIGWRDRETAAKNPYGDVPRYRAAAGRKDIILLAYDAEAFFSHWLKDKGFYKNCGTQPQGGSRCMICAEQEEGGPKYKRDEKYAGIVILLASKKQGGTWEQVNQVLHWGFGHDKYEQLYELAEEIGDLNWYPNHPSGEKFPGVELLVTCQDEGFQRLTIQASPVEKRLPMLAADEGAVGTFKLAMEEARKKFPEFIGPTSIEEQLRALGRDADEGVAEAVSERVEEKEEAPIDLDTLPDTSDEIDAILGGG